MSPEQGKLDVYNTSSNAPGDYDTPIEGTHMIGFRVTAPSNTSTTLAIDLEPSTGESELPELIPVSEW